MGASVVYSEKGQVKMQRVLQCGDREKYFLDDLVGLVEGCFANLPACSEDFDFTTVKRGLLSVGLEFMFSLGENFVFNKKAIKVWSVLRPELESKGLYLAQRPLSGDSQHQDSNSQGSDCTMTFANELLECLSSAGPSVGDDGDQEAEGRKASGVDAVKQRYDAEVTQMNLAGKEFKELNCISNTLKLIITTLDSLNEDTVSVPRRD